MNYPDCIGTLLDPGFNEGIISANKNAILCCSELFRADDGYGGPLEDDVFQQSAKLHCFKGMPIPADDAKTMDTFYYDRAVPFARSKVYDLRSYTAKTRWGPFRKDGSLDVDWVMVEAIMIVLSWNTAVLKTVPESWWESDVFNVPWHQGDFYQAHRANIDESPASYYPENRDFSLDSQDPYGVTGRYRRVRTALSIC